MLRFSVSALAIFYVALSVAGCSGNLNVELEPAVTEAIRPAVSQMEMVHEENEMETETLATFGAGCFWCVEAVFEQYEGVLDVSSGYMGGEKPNPTYREVCTGQSGHAEVVHVRFDSARISYDKLLQTFFEVHDPTTLNRQGADRGTQYRSVIFFYSAEQEAAANAAIKRFAPAFADPIVTEVSAASEYFEAEDYHQDYYRQNKAQPYCQAVIRPKLDKLGLDN